MTSVDLKENSGWVKKAVKARVKYEKEFIFGKIIFEEVIFKALRWRENLRETNSVARFGRNFATGAKFKQSLAIFLRAYLI